MTDVSLLPGRVRIINNSATLIPTCRPCVAPSTQQNTTPLQRPTHQRCQTFLQHLEVPRIALTEQEA